MSRSWSEMGSWKNSRAKLTVKLPSKSESNTTALRRFDGATEERLHSDGVLWVTIFTHANSVFFCCPASEESIKFRVVGLSFHSYGLRRRLLTKQ